MRIVLAACLAFAATPALADLGDDYITAIEAGNDTRVDRLVDMILFSKSVMSPERAAKSIECLKKATGEDYIYFGQTGKFVLPTDLERIRAEQAAKDEQQRVRAAAIAAEQEANREEEAKAQAEREAFSAQLAELKMKREADVTGRLAEGCTAMYRRDPDATITNDLCFDLFFRIGLPD